MNFLKKKCTYTCVTDFKSSNVPSGITDMSLPWSELKNNFFMAKLKIFSTFHVCLQKKKKTLKKK